MLRHFPLPPYILTGLGYFLCAEIGNALARFDNGVAFLWPATALLTAILAVRRPAQWAPRLIVCGIASIVASGLWGHGWVSGIPLAVANLAEAALAATLMRRFLSDEAQIGSLRWLLSLLFGVSVAAPLAGSTIAFSGLALFNAPQHDLIWSTWYLSHALGLIIFLPCFAALAHSQVRRQAFLSGSQQFFPALAFPTAMALVSVLSFAQGDHPLLFLPILVLAASIVFVELVTLTLMYVILAVVGMWFVQTGHSPLALTQADPVRQLQYFQLYLAATALGIMPVAAAVQNMRRLLVRLRESEARYRLLADNSTDIILSTAPDGTIRFISASVLQLGQHHPKSLTGHPALVLVAPRHRRLVLEAYARAMLVKGETVEVEFLGLPAMAAPRWCEAHMRAVLDHKGDVECVVSVIRDMAERKEYETALALAALTDELTGLPNRRLFMDAMQETISKGQSGCVAIIDLDHFKSINDRFGHAAGDEVLKTFARVARQGLRGSDTLARIGGEEFALLLPGAPLEVGERICARLCAALAEAVTSYQGTQITVTTSIGLARLGRHGETAMEQADRALYTAKADGRDRLAIAA
jgi:diguanylate cyclase (GGDEF)-like protein/PAS domain S-box-containing protein